jgi:hypothetical protein
MTLEEKIKLISTTKCNKEGCSFLNQKLSDAEIDLLQNETYKFAIEFAEWYHSANNNEYHLYPKKNIKEHLEIFKKEKGL